jgi:hypothetical protein
VLDVSQRRALERLSAFAAGAGPAIQHACTLSGENSLMIAALVEAVRRAVCPDVSGEEWCATVNAVRTEIIAVTSVGNAARACGVEAEKARAWRESLS